MIRTILVDDEAHNRSTLNTLLAKYCPGILVMAEAANAEDAFLKINALNPQLVLLDIKMPGKSGFNLLRRFSKINFEVIFVTAFNRYAIKAFDFNAVGYILKPIETKKLVKAIDHARERIAGSIQKDTMLHFVQTLSDRDELVTSRLSVHHHGKVVFIDVPDIAFIEAKEDNTILTLSDNSHYYSSKDLVKYESVLEGSGNFMRINKSILVNAQCIKSYSKGEPCVIELKTGQVFEVSRRRKTEILKKLAGPKTV